MCTLDYDDPVAVYTERPRTARKPHTCVGCGAQIHVGEAYSYVSYVGDGTAHSEHECFGCWWTRTVFSEAHGEGPVPSNLWNEVRDCIDGDRDSPWRIHLAAIKRRWRTSISGRRHLARSVFRKALMREIATTRAILRKRLA